MSTLDLNDTYGAMLIGTFFAIFFQGMLSVQAFIYYESFPEDSKKLKSLVAAVWILDFVHLILICQAVYHYLISNWGNDAALSQSTQELDLHLALVGAASILCQAFFLKRVWAFSKHNWILTGVLSIACLVVFALDLVMTIQGRGSASFSVYSSVASEIEVVTMFSLGAGVDLSIALLLVWYLKQGMSSFEKTNFVLTRVIQYTVATGLATSLLALGCVAAYVAKPRGFIFIAMHFSLGRMYTNALLATLNSRRNLRSALQAEIPSCVLVQDGPGFSRSEWMKDSANATYISG
ncbi:hypothetical protein DFH07DRAFT_935083 [Mycena maculata]|uniref:DUF6534 domain-containing protein n=1 Tax=Mycena maculata TaxID=230809 RepID=A0AAD7KIF9_9AGAR|nr:hypothetical protein DFH07DRAFT_935083 [Mycena maculata]